MRLPLKSTWKPILFTLADFRDRVIHHFIYNYISPFLEKTFINDSYSCRIGKGTHYGIKRTDHFIRSIGIKAKNSQPKSGKYTVPQCQCFHHHPGQHPR